MKIRRGDILYVELGHQEAGVYNQVLVRWW